MRSFRIEPKIPVKETHSTNAFVFHEEATEKTKSAKWPFAWRDGITCAFGWFWVYTLRLLGLM